MGVVVKGEVLEVEEEVVGYEEQVGVEMEVAAVVEEEALDFEGGYGGRGVGCSGRRESGYGDRGEGCGD